MAVEAHWAKVGEREVRPKREVRKDILGTVFKGEMVVEGELSLV